MALRFSILVVDDHRSRGNYCRSMTTQPPSSEAHIGSHAAQPAVAAWNLTKVFGEGSTQVTALNNVTVGFTRGRFTAIMGPSGSGKSTLMHMLATLDRPTSGALSLGDTRVDTMNEDEQTRMRRERVGFVFQAFNLVPTLTAKQNILLPLELAEQKPDMAWFNELVERLGLSERLNHKPHELSGGQQQRVAVARALLSRPDVIFGDEPTGNLDSESGSQVLTLLQRAAHEYGQTVIMVTHDPQAASYADRVLLLSDGVIAGEINHPTAQGVAEALAQLGAK